MIYRVLRKHQGVICNVIDGDARPRPLHHVVVHSPDGFNTGYGGSGPADLALSILAHHFREKDSEVKRGGYAWKFHQAFKWEFVSPAKRALREGESFEITTAEIGEWIKKEAARGEEATSDPAASA